MCACVQSLDFNTSIRVMSVLSNGPKRFHTGPGLSSCPYCWATLLDWQMVDQDWETESWLLTKTHHSYSFTRVTTEAPQTNHTAASKKPLTSYKTWNEILSKLALLSNASLCSETGLFVGSGMQLTSLP